MYYDPESNRYGISDGNSPDRPTAGVKVSNSQTLTSILSLLETRITIDDEKHEKSENDAKTRRDWMLAAAVIDRLCFIALIIVFISGTLVFVILFLQS